MNDIIENGSPALDVRRDESLRTIGHISYALHAIEIGRASCRERV